PTLSSGEEPPRDLVAAHVPLLGRDRIADVVLPHTPDLEEPLRHPLLTEPELVCHAATRAVARHDGGFDPVQVQIVESVTQDNGNTFRDEALPCVQCVDPIAHERRLERSPLHAAEAHFADERAVVQEQPESVRGVEVPLALPRAATGAERLGVGDGVGTPRTARGLPRPEAAATARAHVPPGVEVSAP